MESFWIDPANPDNTRIRQAAALIKAGGVAVFPTDTVYGLGASIFHLDAIERLFKIKGRLKSKGLIAMIADIADVEKVCCEIPDQARALMTKFWPGPLTLVMPASDSIPRLMAVDGTIGVRLPNSRLAIELIRSVGEPLATTSANISGRASLLSVDEAKDALGDRVDVYIDGGLSPIGLESTVVDPGVEPLRIYREGAISKEAILEVP
ncbi:MAG TPA: threonylcarbamoyl-AMP synthase [Actinobacteria bacterium]|nr:threonylcarbamoyl-AMP synthase [Actinomycetota bacterium]